MSDWPQTRTTLPVTPAEAGQANHAIVSATSTGSPPCERLFIRRPASRGPNGIAAVIGVSMNPGATALMVKSRIHVSPFFEDGIDDLVNLVGVDQVLYGSDWPHPEGLAEPTFYVNALSHLSVDDQAKIMGGNLGRLVTT
jgi:hypothetical protein